MRAFAAAAALALAMAPAALAAKYVNTIGEWTDPASKPMPDGMPAGYTWSYYPNSFGTTCASQDLPCCGDNGEEPCSPLNWATQYPLCDPANGKQQTPINFDINEGGYSSLGKGAALKLESGKCSGEVVKKNGTWEVEFYDCDKHGQKGFAVTDRNGKRWKLWQMHLHGVSEHTVNGGYYPLEVHLVHIPYEEALNTDTVTQALVLGVFLSPGAKTSNKILDIITHYPADDQEHLWRAVDIYNILPKNKAYWHYTGSLTTPPCQLSAANFNVQWYVFKTPSTMSPAQMTWFSQYFSTLPVSYLGQNNRPIQPIQQYTNLYSYGKRLN